MSGPKEGDFARRLSDGALIEILYRYDDWVHYRTVETDVILVDRHIRTVEVLSPLETMGMCSE